MGSRKSINIRYLNRPVKVAFIVPLVEEKICHWILDGIFDEAYSRWGGAKSLIVPCDINDFIPARYLDWLEVNRPDFLRQFVASLNTAFQIQ